MPVVIIILFSITVGLIVTLWIISRPERFDLKEESEELINNNKNQTTCKSTEKSK